MPLAGYLLQKKNINVCMTVGALLTIAGIAGFAFAANAYHFIICGLFIGFGMPYLFGLAEVMLIGNWFAVKYQGRVLGISMGCLGLAVAVWSPLFTWLVQNLGFQTTYLINAALVAVLILPWTLFVFKRDPADKNLLPYGVEEGHSDDALEADAHVGMRPGKAFRTVGFWMVYIAACTTSIGMAFDNHQPSIAIEFLAPDVMSVDAAVSFSGWLLSCYGIGQVAGTFGFGWLLDRMKMKPVYGLFLVMFAATFAVWTFWHSQAGLVAAALLLGTHNGLATVGYPLLIRRLFGGKYYSRIYSIVNMSTAFLGGLATTLVSLSYDALGSYANVIMVAFCLICCIAVCSFVAMSRIGKYKWEDDGCAPALQQV